MTYVGMEAAFPIQQPEMPFLAVPRQTRPVKTEVESLRERVAALEAQIAAVVAAQAPEPAGGAPQPVFLRTWPGAGGINQLTGKPTWV